MIKLAIYYFPENDPDFEGIISYSPMHIAVCPEKPFGDVSAEEYLEFARNDLSRGDRAGLVNALGNAKRCFHYQVDRLFYRFGLLKAANSLNFPQKIELLRELQIVSGTLLRAFNRERNAMEHDYVAPTAEIAEGSVDLCELLLLATERFLCEVPMNMRVVLEDDDRDLIFQLEAGANTLKKYEIVGTTLIETKYGKKYKESLYKFGEDTLAEGISINPLPAEEIALTIPNKPSWLNLLRMFSSSAKQKRHQKHPNEPYVYMQHAIPWKDAKKIFQAMNEVDKKKS